MPDTFIPVARPWLGQAEADATARVLTSGWITQGPEVAAFERELGQYLGAPYACAVSNCTTALHLALLAAGVGPGDEVVTLSHSFIATANSIRASGATPVFIDIEPDTYNLDANLLRAAIGPSTKAILCVHQLGMPCDLATIVRVAREMDLPVIEDAACAIGSEILWQGRWEKIGAPHGDAACFSFHPRKVLTTGEGGMITTRRSDWDKKFRLWRQHGMNVPDTVRHGAREVIFETYSVAGYNYRLTDLQAAVGREQLRRLPEMLERRRYLASRYHANLAASSSGLRLPVEPAFARSNWQSYCVGLPSGCNQRSVMQLLLDEGIGTRRGVMCSHREQGYPPGSWRCPAGQGLRNSEVAQDTAIILPLYHELMESEQDRVMGALSSAVQRKPMAYSRGAIRVGHP